MNGHEPNGKLSTGTGVQTPPANPRVLGAEEERSYWWVWMLLLLLVAGGIAFVYVRHRNAQAAASAPAAGKAAMAKSTPVVAAVARRGDMNIYLTGLGSVTALNTVTVRTRVDGQLDQVAFTEGQLVKERDLLVQIDPRPFQVQLAQAQGQMAKDQASLENAQLNVKRDQDAGTAISGQQLSTDVATVHQLEGTVKSDQAQIDSAQLQLTYSRITAPLTGRIGLRLVDKGNIVHSTDQNGLAVITQLQPIALVFTIPEDSLAQVLKKTNAGQTLEVDAYDRDLKNKLAVGKLMAIDNQIDPTTGTVKLKGEFVNADSLLYPNQFVNARLLVDTKRDVILIPTAGVQRSPNSTFAYVVKPDNTVEMRDVTAGPSEGDDTLILSGLSAGEVVVTEGVDKLVPGSKVSVSKAEPSRPATQPGASTRPGAGEPGGGGRHSHKAPE